MDPINQSIKLTGSEIGLSALIWKVNLPRGKASSKAYLEICCCTNKATQPFSERYLGVILQQ